VIGAEGPIVPGINCYATGSDVACPVDPRRLLYVSVAGLAGNDTLSAIGGIPRRGEVQFDGGPGSDQLVGTAGDDVLLAGPDGRDVMSAGKGSDALISGPGRDLLRGGHGNDQLVTNAPCDGHVFAGGPGHGDIAGFARAARARLRARLGGKAVDVRKRRCRGTKLRLSNEILEGTRNGDLLIGTPGNDPLILGGSGADRMLGLGGRDLLRGEDGRDVFLAGKGTDVLRAKDGRRDRLLDCGPGTDFVKRDGIDPPPKDCGLSVKERRMRAKEERERKR
jgi:Ca2+-binding RTX toxin-like protein